jgi:lipoprotein-anchoring transpeptidase ErfK/SrfK
VTFQIAGKSSIRFAIGLVGLVAVIGLGVPADAGLFKKKPPPVDYVDADFENLPPIKGENQLAKNLRRTPVYYRSPYPAGTIIVDTSDRYLYLLVGQGRAIRYGVAVGRDGYTWEGSMKVSKKTEWPDWRPPADMIARAKKEGKTLPTVVKGGPGNPLGARALYLGNSEYRIHGTNAPKSIGHNASSGCIRMLNEHVIDLYGKVPVGTRVVVIA